MKLIGLMPINVGIKYKIVNRRLLNESIICNRLTSKWLEELKSLRDMNPKREEIIHNDHQN